MEATTLSEWYSQKNILMDIPLLEEIFWANDHFSWMQDQISIKKKEKMMEDFQTIQSRIYVHFLDINFTIHDMEREWETILILYRSVWDSPLDNSGTNIEKINDILRNIATNIMLRRQSETTTVCSKFRNKILNSMDVYNKKPK